MSDLNQQSWVQNPNNKSAYSPTKQNTETATPVDQSGSVNSPPGGNVVSNAPSSSTDTPRVLPRQVSTGVSRGVQQLGGSTLYADSANNQIIVNPGVPNVLMGDQPTFGSGFFVGKPGVDVTTAANASDFIFNSNQDVFKIVLSGTIDITINSSPINNFIIPHDLGFAPIPFAFLTAVSISGVSTMGLNTPFPIFLNATLDTIKGTATNSGNPLPIIGFASWIYCSCDDQRLLIEALNATGGSLGTFQIAYYLLQESANG